MTVTYYAVHHRVKDIYAKGHWSGRSDFVTLSQGLSYKTIFLYKSSKIAMNAIIRVIERNKNYSNHSDFMEFLLGLEVIEVTMNYDTTKVIGSALFAANKL